MCAEPFDESEVKEVGNPIKEPICRAKRKSLSALISVHQKLYFRAQNASEENNFDLTIDIKSSSSFFRLWFLP